MRHAGPVRRELATRTIFNVLGPLRTRPARARRSSASTPPALVPTIAEALVQLDARRAYVVHGAGGIDELSPAGPNLVCEVEDGAVRQYELDPLELGIERCDPAELAAAIRRRTRAALRDVLRRRRQPGGHRSAVAPQRGRRDRRGRPRRRSA